MLVVVGLDGLGQEDQEVDKEAGCSAYVASPPYAVAATVWSDSHSSVLSPRFAFWGSKRPGTHGGGHEAWHLLSQWRILVKPTLRQ